MKIFGKLLGAFALVALLCAIVGAVGCFGIGTTEDGLIEVGRERLPAVKGLGMMMEGINAVKAAERTMLIGSLSAAERHQEYQKLEGRWGIFDEGLALYETVPRDAEGQALWSKLKPAIEHLRGEHRKLVDLVDQVNLDDVGRLETILTARLLDHKKWVNALDKAILEGRHFDKQLNPQLCAFGKWLGPYTTPDAEFNAILDSFHRPHEQLHGLGGQINGLIAAGNAAQARDVFKAEVLPTLAGIEKIFARAIDKVRLDIDRLERGIDIGFGSEREAFNAVNTLLDQLVEMNSVHSLEVVQAAEASAATARLVSGSTVSLAILIALVFGYLLARSIAAPMKMTVQMIEELEQGRLGRRLNMNRADEIGQMAKAMDAFAESLQNEVVATMQALAEGDLTRDIKPRDGQDVVRGAIRKVCDDLNGVLAQILVAAQQITAGSSQVSDSGQSLSQGATESASSLEQISASLNQMAGQTKLSAENANQANQLSIQARGAAEKGNVQMVEMVEAMGEINDSSQNISKIIKVIDEIAFQTNLLALNAAVEAARAGQHGKGFAVVAEEVRNLAARSAKAAQETAQLIEGSVQKVSAGSQIADRTAEALGEIVTGVTKVTDLVAEIAASSNEQAEGITQINQGLTQIDQVTQQNTANAEESAASAEELSSQAAQMQQMLQRFRLKGLSTGGGGVTKTPVLQAPHRTSLVENAGWGEGRGGDSKDAPGPSDFIALDDDEFGKY